MEGKTVARLLSKSPLVLLAVLLSAFVISCTAAGPSHVYGYQGRLTDSSGRPINGNKSITFSLWDASSAGNKVSEETRTVAVTDGLMNMDIGQTLTDAYNIPGIDPAVFAQPLWLQLVIEGETLSPRQKLMGAPYAMTLPGGAVVASLHEGNGAGGIDSTDIDYGTLSVVSVGGGTALFVGIPTTGAGDAIRVCGSPSGSSRSCANPTFRVLSNGNVRADGTFTPGGADFAENIRVEPAHTYVPGDVLAISSAADRSVVPADQPYSPAVVGVYSTKPGFVGGGVIEQTSADGSTIPVALVGIVPVKVSAENGAIHRGDLLTTSSTPGHAMKATEFRVGTILGKAMGELEEGTGLIEVLLTLQ